MWAFSWRSHPWNQIGFFFGCAKSGNIPNKMECFSFFQKWNNFRRLLPYWFFVKLIILFIWICLKRINGPNISLKKIEPGDSTSSPINPHAIILQRYNFIYSDCLWDIFQNITVFKFFFETFVKDIRLVKKINSSSIRIWNPLPQFIF